MDFNFLSRFQKKEEKKEFFLALLFKPFSISAILFEQVRDTLVILSSSEHALEHEVSELALEQLIQASDTVISTVEQQLVPGALLSKTIFSLPVHFVEDGKIKKDYLVKFKKLCDDLDLIPVGFIVTIEAVVSSLQKKEGVPITAIFVEITRDSLYMYLVRAGNIVEVKHEAHAGHYAKTVELLLKNITSFDVLPQKMVLLDYEKIENIAQEFLSFPWTKDLPFLHLPQVIHLERGFENEAVINGVALQMGFEVLVDKSNEAFVSSHTVATSDEKTSRGSDVEKSVSDNSFGFVKEEDVALTSVSKSHTESVSEPVLSKEISNQVSTEIVVPSESLEMQEGFEHGETYEKSFSVPKVRSFFGLFSFSKLSFRSPRLIIGIVGVVFLIALFVYAYYSFILQVEVILFLDKKIIDTSSKVELSAKNPTSFEKKNIKMDLITVEKEDSVTADTTGKKETGEKAKGEVTIYNKTEDKKTFDKGTIIIGPNRLEYELTDSVSIASTSAFSTNFSNSKAKVVATSFGSEYNIPSGSNFTVKNISSSEVFAKNDQAFSGGSKKEIQVVADSDLKDLENTLVENLKGKVDQDFKAKASGNNILIPSVLSSEFVTKNFSKKEGEEAKKVTLTGQVAFKSGAYNGDELLTFMKDATSDGIPSGYSFIDSESKSRLKDITNDKDTVSAQLEMHAVYTPKIDEKKIIEEIAGKSRDEAFSIIEKAPSVRDRSIRFKRSLPFMPSFLPNNRSAIKIVIQTNG